MSEENQQVPNEASGVQPDIALPSNAKAIQAYCVDASEALTEKYNEVEFTIGDNQISVGEVFSPSGFLPFFNYLALTRMRFLFNGLTDERGFPVYKEMSEPNNGVFGFKSDILFKNPKDSLLFILTINDLVAELIGDSKHFSLDSIYNYAHGMAGRSNEGGYSLPNDADTLVSEMSENTESGM